jgi:hypothetical protein
MQLYVPAAGGGFMEVLQLHHDDPITGRFGAKRTIELESRKYYRPGMSCEVKAYTGAGSTCQRVHPLRHRPHGGMELLP